MNLMTRIDHWTAANHRPSRCANLMARVDHWTGADHRPSRCAIAAGKYLGAVFVAEILAVDGGAPYPVPPRACDCPCRNCQRDHCDTLDPRTRDEVWAAEAGLKVPR